jgi:hypothetical protein
MQGNGFLAIWSDIATSQETDYLHWLTREHTAERLGVDGFLAVRVFRSVDDNINRFLILYELASPEALAGPSYLARLNAPTPWSQRIVPILQNFVRGGGRRVASAGTGRGGWIAALPSPGAGPDGAGILAALVGQDRIAAAHLLQTDTAKTAIRTNEKSLRGDDRSFDALLIVEGLDRVAIRQALSACPAALSGGTAAADVPLYTCIFALDGRD